MSLTNRLASFSAKNATPSDTVVAPTVNGQMPDAFMVLTTAGDVSVLTDLGDTMVVKTVALGNPVQLKIQRVNSTGTTAVGIAYLYHLTP